MSSRMGKKLFRSSACKCQRVGRMGLCLALLAFLCSASSVLGSADTLVPRRPFDKSIRRTLPPEILVPRVIIKWVRLF